jgi:hypothetical protein
MVAATMLVRHIAQRTAELRARPQHPKSIFHNAFLTNWKQRG